MAGPSATDENIVYILRIIRSLFAIHSEIVHGKDLDKISTRLMHACAYNTHPSTNGRNLDVFMEKKRDNGLVMDNF